MKSTTDLESKTESDETIKGEYEEKRERELMRKLKQIKEEAEKVGRMWECIGEALRRMKKLKQKLWKISIEKLKKWLWNSFHEILE